MYNEHFGLQQAPFRITPDTRIFYPGGGRGEVLDALVYAITSGEGIIKVVGEVGTGKTMLCRMLEERLPEHVDFVYLANPSLAPDDIVQAIALEMTLEYPANANRLQIMHLLQQRLLEKHAQNRQVVIFIEEAQSMPIETLEEIRLLSNLETKQEKLLQIVLFGQPELDDYLEQVNIRPLRERITHSFYLEPFSRHELQKYVDFRMRAAGYRGRELFRPNAYSGMARVSEGLVRRINILADKALLAAFAEGAHDVRRKHVRKAIDDSQFERRRRSRAPEIMMVSGLVMAVMSITFTVWEPGRSAFESLLANAKQIADSASDGSAPKEVMASAADSVGFAPKHAEAIAHDAQTASSGGDAVDLVAESIGEVPADSTAESRPSVSAVAKAELGEDATPADLATVAVTSAGTETASLQVESAPAPRAQAETIALVSSSTGPGGPPLGTDGAANDETGARAAAVDALPEASTEVAATEATNGESGPGDANDGAVPEAMTTITATETLGAGADSDEASGSAVASTTLAATEASEGEAGFQQPARGDSSRAVTPESTVLAVVADVAAIPQAADWTSVDAADTASGLLASRLEVTRRWLADTDGGHFTIQLLRSFDKRRRHVAEFLVQQYRRGEIEHIYVYETLIRQRLYLGVLYGDFSTFTEANRAIKDLPEAFKLFGPFVRNVRDITTSG